MMDQIPLWQWTASDIEVPKSESTQFAIDENVQTGLLKLMQVAALCSNAKLQLSSQTTSPTASRTSVEVQQIEHSTIVGSATETALLEMLPAVGLDSAITLSAHSSVSSHANPSDNEHSACLASCWC